MKRIEVYQSDNGQLETDLQRAKASDITYAVERLHAAEPGPSTLKIGPKIDWHVAMEILKYHSTIKEHIEEYERAQGEKSVS